MLSLALGETEVIGGGSFGYKQRFLLGGREGGRADPQGGRLWAV